MENPFKIGDLGVAPFMETLLIDDFTNFIRLPRGLGVLIGSFDMLFVLLISQFWLISISFIVAVKSSR